MSWESKRTRAVAALAALALLVLSPGVPAQVAASGTRVHVRNHFDFDTVLAEPGFFDFVVLGAPVRAEWRVTVGDNPPSTPNQVDQIVADRTMDSIAVAVRRNVSFRDGSLALAMLKGSGHGGIAFRLSGEGEENFLALLIDLTTGDARLTAYRDGHPTQLAHGVAALTNEWGVLSIRADGPRISAQWDGKPLLEGVDPRPVPGRAGMATVGPGMVSFDEFLLDSGGR